MSDCPLHGSAPCTCRWPKWLDPADEAAIDDELRRRGIDLETVAQRVIAAIDDIEHWIKRGRAERDAEIQAALRDIDLSSLADDGRFAAGALWALRAVRAALKLETSNDE